jgi:hypothetical protein
MMNAAHNLPNTTYYRSRFHSRRKDDHVIVNTVNNIF